MFNSDSAAAQPARIITGQIQITCQQGTQPLLDLSYAQYFQIQLRLIIASWICSW